MKVNKIIRDADNLLVDTIEVSFAMKDLFGIAYNTTKSESGKTIPVSANLLFRNAEDATKPGEEIEITLGSALYIWEEINKLKKQNGMEEAKFEDAEALEKQANDDYQNEN